MSDTSLLDIINKTNKKPTITNENSNFVVITYWWGRGNWNGNTARPCISFFEEITNVVIKYTINFILTLFKEKVIKKNYNEIINNIVNHISLTSSFNNIVEKYSRAYQNIMYDDLKIYIDKDQALRKSKLEEIIKEYKKNGKTNPEFMVDPEKIKSDMKEIMLKIIDINKQLIFDNFLLKKHNNTLKDFYMNEKEFFDNNDKKDILNKLKLLKDFSKDLQNKIKTNMKFKTTYDLIGKRYENMNIYDILNERFRYIQPIHFETMIDNWEKECGKNGCNYLSVEYPEFAKDQKGYQMAINAKPLFIQKALELCEGKGVLYIDGDMYIRKYPHIFDIENVDFMARGWWIDPRSSYKMDESILYDPYTFETSGGTMFFSQSHESKVLVKEWIKESAEKRQEGKADDRILSLIFNSKKFLLNMNIIQLPIEYLWLTLDYNYRIMELIYDWDRQKMNSTIFIEHPECLTSEETASGAGASSDRTPKYYDFLSLDESLTPASEELHEYLFFPNKEYVSSFEEYLKYMSDKQYIDDGNIQLVEKHFVDIDEPTNNEQPLYITKYDDKYGKRNNIYEKNKKIINEELNQTYLDKNILNTKKIGPFGFIELDASMIPGEEYEIPIIISLLSKGYNILYKPEGTSAEDYYTILAKEDTNLEFSFFPVMKEMTHNLKPIINLSKPIFFRGLNDNSRQQLIKVLYMFDSFENLSYYLNNGSYEILSRIRIGYVFNKKTKKTGGSETTKTNQVNSFIKDYEDGFNVMYGSKLINGGSLRKKSKNYKTKKNKIKSKNKRQTKSRS